ncbi:MAG: NAD(P)-binding protein [Woeseiaceae bacterium]|nr:NAD(P)-binding protein [Woeseiaceae bacterium]
MNNKDKQLGMSVDISRRDFINGVGVTIGASFTTDVLASTDIGAQDMPGYYPPELTGMRGSHPGSFEGAHSLRDGMVFDTVESNEEYDLVVVGAGISGLAAAYFYQKNTNKNARILILDNHDDFGGHAKRNEFSVDGKTIIGFGGTMFLEEPSGYPVNAKQLLIDLGVDIQRFYKYFHHDLYSSYGLTRGVFFDKETFGQDYLAVGEIDDVNKFANAPISETAKRDLVRLYEDDNIYLPKMSSEEYYSFLEGISYETYLREYADMPDEIIKTMQSAARGVWAVNIDAFPASAAWIYGYPGFGNIDPVDQEQELTEPNIFHFPDGNATIARLLVRHLIPKSAMGNSMEDIVTARFKYNELDNPSSNVSIRLNSTVIKAKHYNENLSGDVEVSYLRDGKIHTVEAKKVIMACYNSIIPRLCPEMPTMQKNALKNCIRAPLVYTNVLIRNWHSFVKLGVYRITTPGMLHHNIRLDFPVSMGDYHCSTNPGEPIILHMQYVPGDHGNPSARQQFLEGQKTLLSTPFEELERSIRNQLSRVLSPGGFDVANDILAITVNRWPHGYAYSYDSQSDRIAFDTDAFSISQQNWVIGREVFGNISIASTDSASNAMTETAIEQANRAVGDLVL